MRRSSRWARLVTCLTLAALAVPSAFTAQASDAVRAKKRGPINARLVVDSARAAHATITAADGGRVAVSTTNGTRITIAFPPRAVAADTVVTATPVTRLSNRSLHPGLVAGVQLQPEGLELLAPATVRVVRRGRPHRGTRLVFVGSDGTGRDVHRLPPPFKVRGHGRGRRAVVTPGPVLSITHFSTVEGFDWSAATVAELDAIVRPELGQALLEQRVATLLRTHADWDAIEAAFEEGLARFIEPLLTTTETKLTTGCSEKNVTGAHAALQIALGFNRQSQLIGFSARVPSGALASVLTKAASCMVKLCPTLGDPRVGYHFLLIAHQFQVLGIVTDGAYYAALYTNLERCGTFEVHLDSRIDSAYGLGSFSTRVEARVTVVPPSIATGSPPAPRGPLTYTSATGAIVTTCDTTEFGSTTPGELEVSDVTLGTYDEENPRANPVLSLKITVKTPPKETLHTRYTPTDMSCSPGGLPPDQPTVYWNVGFQAEHPDYTFPGADFARAPAPVFALAVYGPHPVPFVDGTVSENTLVELIHKPGEPVPLPAPD